MFRPPFYDEHPVLIHPAAPQKLLRLFRWILLAAVVAGLARVLLHHTTHPERNKYGNSHRTNHRRSLDPSASDGH